VTNASKYRSLKSICFLSCLILSCGIGRAQAQQVAPALFNVQEIQVQHGRIGSAVASANCGVSTGEIAAMVLAALKVENLPVFSVLNAPPLRPSVARVDAFPDVITLQPREKECISWVALSVQSKEPLQIDPIKTPRNLITTYWTGGLMVGSSALNHANTIKDAYLKLAEQFGRQYRLDQPPDVSNEKTEKETAPPSIIDTVTKKQ